MTLSDRVGQRRLLSPARVFLFGRGQGLEPRVRAKTGWN